jgi:hypothetical protein
MPPRKKWSLSSTKELAKCLYVGKPKTYKSLGSYTGRTVTVVDDTETMDWQQTVDRLVRAQDSFADMIARAQARSIRAAQARQVFDWLEVVFPRRVTSEEIGDALETIHGLATDPACSRPGLKIAVKTVTTIFWVVLNSIRLISSSILGKKAE